MQSFKMMLHFSGLGVYQDLRLVAAHQAPGSIHEQERSTISNRWN